jgi:hypothetical protein
MKKRIVAIIAVVALMGLLLPAAVFAADTGAVTCTVSAVLVSVSVTPSSVAYGTVNVGAVKNTALYSSSNNPNGSNSAQTLTVLNNGSGTENYNIKSSNATGTVTWTLGGSQGANQFTHAALPLTDSAYTGGALIGTFSIAMTTPDGYVSLTSSVASAATKYLELQIGMPTSTTDYGSHSITVTIQATQ